MSTNQVIVSQLRNFIIDNELKIKAQHIWQMAEKELHPFQQGRTAQDFLHSCRVEDNIWRLIRENLSKFSSTELFILSASAALHDLGKIESSERKDAKIQPDEDHGEKAKKILLNGDDWRKFHFDRKVEAEAVALIIGVHSTGNIEKLPEEPFLINSERVFLRSIAAIFRLADMLDSDSRRWPFLAKILKEMRFPDQVETWVGRRSIGEWGLSNDCKTILLQASPDNDEDKIKTLAYVDSLNQALTPSHKKYLENCTIEYLCENKAIIETLHFPFRFSYCEFDGAVRREISGLKALYNEFAVEYIDRPNRHIQAFHLRV